MDAMPAFYKDEGRFTATTTTATTTTSFEKHLKEIDDSNLTKIDTWCE